MSEGEASRREAARYSRDADRFAREAAPRLRGWSSRLLERLPLAGARLVLDVGTGTGGLLGALRAAAPDALVVGTDLAEGMLEVAAREVGRPLARMDAQRLGLRGGCADAAVLSFVLHRTVDPGAVLAEVGRVLRPGGVVGTVTWGSQGGSEAGRIWAGLLAARGLGEDPHAVDSSAQVDRPARVRALAQAAGLEPLAAWTEASEERHGGAEDWLAAALASGSGRRLDAAGPNARAECLAAARARMAGLPPSAFAVRTQVVYALARRRPRPDNR